jgi:Helix-turn-helix domain
MRSIAYALPSFPGFAGPRTYAAWPVWKDSAREEVRFAPLPKKEAAKRWHKARRFDRQTHTPGKHGGALGRSGLAVFYVLLFDFLDHTTGRLEPSYDAIAQKAGVCRRTVSEALKRLRELGLLHWQRRCHEGKDEAGNFRLIQETNAYAVLPPSHWRGYHEPPPAPPPDPGTWGDHPPLPGTISQAADELRHGQQRTALSLLDLDPADALAGALARLGRAILGPQS